ncbi:MmgE/PrpD family protein [Actibacterium mucosum]
MTMDPIAQKLIDFTLTARPGAEARAVMQLSLYDWLACGLAGRPEPLARITREQALAEGGAELAMMLGGGRVPARAAALVNGATSHALDYDDTHFAHIGHPSVAVIPAVLAVGSDDVVGDALIGAEASVAVGMWLGRGPYKVGFHPTAIAGAIGATLGAARARGLTAEQTGHALGIAATKAAGLISTFGTMAKPLNAGLAAECGVVATDLAARGFIANPGSLAGPNGLWATHHGDGDAGALNTLGADWRMVDVSHKLHACCHGLHAMLEALSGTEGTPEAVQVTTHSRWMPVCNIAEPATGLQAKFSYRHTAAMALSGMDTGDIGSFTDACANDPRLMALRRRVAVITDDTLSEMQARVVVDGKALFHDLAAPMPLSLRTEKLRRKGRALLGDLEPEAWNVTARPQVTADALQPLMGV